MLSDHGILDRKIFRGEYAHQMASGSGSGGSSCSVAAIVAIATIMAQRNILKLFNIQRSVASTVNVSDSNITNWTQMAE
jgi:hypothetical protein